MNNLNQFKEFLNPLKLNVTTLSRRPILSNLFVGIGIYHAIQNEDSGFQAVLAFIFPSSYIGYHSFKNYEKIKTEIKSFSKN
jgi:hypothetical protein